MLEEIIKNEVRNILKSQFNKDIEILSSSSLSGGSINEAVRLETNIGVFFLKWNSSSLYPAMFEKEANGLSILKQADEIFIPAVISCGDVGAYSFLLLEYVDSARPIENFWTNFAQSLAALHKKNNDFFGLDHDNYIGSLFQGNKEHDNWISFFIEERLESQLKLARDEAKATSSLTSKFEKLFNRLEDIFPPEKPSLIHGDLWSGNFMVNSKGKACILDPAVYYGHREMDIAMSKLFGGFTDEFYSAYNNVYPMEKGWEERVDICNLYPLMVHVNLFGGGYLNSVESILAKF